MTAVINTIRDCDTLVFDLDGTLADTAEDIREALVEALAAYDLPPIDTRTVRFMVGGGERVLIVRALDRLCQDANKVPVDGLVKAFHNAYLARRNAASRLFPGVRQTLERLHAADLKLGICSNKPQDLCDALVRDLGLAPFIDTVVGADGERPRKPDPTGLAHAMALLGGAPETTLYVGDSDTDVATGRAAGCRVALVNYGYSVRPASQLGADLVVDSLAELDIESPVAQSA